MNKDFIHSLRRSVLFLPLLAMISFSAFALDLGAAKSQGLVGETPSGYLAAVKPATPAVQSLINDINSRRKAEYQKIATRNGTPLNVVEQLSGKKLIESAPAGHYVQSGGNWVRK